jgi:hypothetical protein
MVSGSDANMIYAANCDVQSAGYGMPGNGGIGILDAGFLNSTWINCEVANDPTIGGGASIKRTLAGVPSVFVNCYTEGYGSPSDARIESDCDTSAIFIGGNHGAGFAAGSTAMVVDSGNVRGCRYLTGINAGGAANLLSYMGRQDGINAFGWGHASEAFVTGVNYSTAFGWDAEGWWPVGPQNDATVQSYAIPRSTAVWPSGTALDAAARPFWVTQGRLHVGVYTADPPSVGFGSAAPASGYFVQGSITFNSAPAAGQPVGWVCTVTGTPGTWVAMANL